MPPKSMTPPTSSLPGVKTPGTEGRAGLNINGSIPVRAFLPVEERAWGLPTRPVPVRQAGGPTGSGLGVKQSTPATGAKGLGAEVTKSWEKANKATEKDIASSVDAWRQAEADIGKEGAMLRSGWYQEAKADADESIRKAMEASAQLGVVMSPYLLGRINVQARAVATAGYRMKSAELALSENAQRLQVASGISNVYQNIQRQGIDPGLAAGMAQQLGVGRAARDANGRLLNDQKTQNNRFLDELNKILNPKKPGAAGSPRPGAPGTPRQPIRLPDDAVLPTTDAEWEAAWANREQPLDLSGAKPEAPGVPTLPIGEAPLAEPPPSPFSWEQDPPEMIPGPVALPPILKEWQFRLPEGFLSGDYLPEAVSLIKDTNKLVLEGDRGTALAAKFMEMVELMKKIPKTTNRRHEYMSQLWELRDEFNKLRYKVRYKLSPEARRQWENI